MAGMWYTNNNRKLYIHSLKGCGSYYEIQNEINDHVYHDYCAAVVSHGDRIFYHRRLSDQSAAGAAAAGNELFAGGGVLSGCGGDGG